MIGTAASGGYVLTEGETDFTGCQLPVPDLVPVAAVDGVVGDRGSEAGERDVAAAGDARDRCSLIPYRAVGANAHRLGRTEGEIGAGAGQEIRVGVERDGVGGVDVDDVHAAPGVARRCRKCVGRIGRLVTC